MGYIKASVGMRNGKQCYNVVDDQITVISLLNSIPNSNGGSQDTPLPNTPQWGACSDQLYNAILRFQSRYSLPVDGHVDPGGQTILRMNQAAGDSLPGAPPATNGNVGPSPVVGTTYYDPWSVDDISVSGASFVDVTGFSALAGTIRFRRVNEYAGFSIKGAGFSAGVSASLDKVLSAGQGTAEKIVRSILINASISVASFPSATNGVCVSFAGLPQRWDGPLESFSFPGTCCGIYVGGNITVLGATGYALFFGMPEHYWEGIVAALAADVPTMGLANLAIAGMLSQAKGIAFLGNAGVGLSASAGLSASQFIGVIG